MSDHPPISQRPPVGSRRSRQVLRYLLLVSVTLLVGSCDRLVAREPLVVAFGERPVTLDPHMQDRSAAWSVLTSLCDGLASLSPEMKLQPALAIAWENVDDTHWRFTLRSGVRFHDGSPLVADDVVASFNRGLGLQESAVRHYLAGVKSVVAEGPRSVLVETAGPLPDLLNRLTFLLVVPASQARARRIETPIGTGPYRFVERDTNGDIVVRAWEGWRGRPAIDSARFTFHASANEAANALIAGRADVCHLLPPDRVAEIAGLPGLRAVQQPRLAVQLLSIHLSEATGQPNPLADVRVRRAILLALDRQTWVDRWFMGSGTIASQLVHPAVFGYDPSIRTLPHDPRSASELLDEAGYGDGFDLTVTYRPSQEEVANLIVADLAKVGVQARAVATGPASLPSTSCKLDYFSWACATGDASDLLNTMVRSRDDAIGVGSGSVPVLTDPEIDSLLAAADHELDPDRRRLLLQQAQRLAVENLPILPLTVMWGYKGVADRVEVVTRFDQQDRIAEYRWRR